MGNDSFICLFIPHTVALGGSPGFWGRTTAGNTNHKIKPLLPPKDWLCNILSTPLLCSPCGRLFWQFSLSQGQRTTQVDKSRGLLRSPTWSLPPKTPSKLSEDFLTGNNGPVRFPSLCSFLLTLKDCYRKGRLESGQSGVGGRNLPGIYKWLVGSTTLPHASSPLGPVQPLLRTRASVLMRLTGRSNGMAWRAQILECEHPSRLQGVGDPSNASRTADVFDRGEFLLFSSAFWKNSRSPTWPYLGLSRLRRDLFLSLWAPQLGPLCMEHLTPSWQLLTFAKSTRSGCMWMWVSHRSCH